MRLLLSAAVAMAFIGAAAAATFGVDAYAGKYPSLDAVNGVTFIAQPVVVNGAKKAVSDKSVLNWLLGMDTTEVPIFVRGGQVFAHACEPHNCGDHDWTIVVTLASNAVDVCYHDAAMMRPDEARWYLASGKSEMRAGDCPQS